MLLKSAFTTPCVMILCGAFAFAQETPVTQPTRINHPTEIRQHIERGARGSRTKKTPQTFSGHIHQSFEPRDPGLKGALERPPLNHLPENGQLPDPTVTLKSVHKASFENVAPETTGRTVMAVRNGAALETTASDPRAFLVSPQDGSTVAPSQTFTWTQGSGISAYGLWVGSCYDCTDILDENEGRSTSRTIGLPNDGRIIYVTLFSLIGPNWYWVDYEFVASRPVVAAALTSPGNGATLDSPQTFNWSAGNNVTGYYLTVGSCFDCGDILDEGQGTNTSRSVYLPTDGRTIFVTLYSFGNDGYWYWYDYQFRAPAIVTVPTYRVYITNDYLYSLNIFVNGKLVGSVNPGSKQYTDQNVSPVTVSFELNQPTLAGNTLGDRVAGYWNKIDHPAGTYNLEASYQLGSTFYFLPQVSNRTAQPLAIEVNGGYQSENRCNCEAPAHTENVRAGYYELFSNSNVRLFYPGNNYTGLYLYFGTDSTGSTSPGGPLYKLVSVPSGLITLVADRLP